MSLFEDQPVEPLEEEPVIDLAEENSGLLPPRDNLTCFGFEDLEQSLLKAFNADRFPHAVILAGPTGIGKATFAYRVARFLLAQEPGGGLFGGDETPAVTMDISADNEVVRRVSSGGHADLLTVGRVYDPKKKKLSNDIPVDEVRKITPFLRKTSSDGGWRVVIVDDAHHLNRSSQNALLKILEEPPKKTVLILVADQPGRFLPTIRSRCQIYNCGVLKDEYMKNLLEIYDPHMPQDTVTALSNLGQGRIGRAIELMDAGGLEIYQDVIELLSKLPKVDVQYAYDLSEKLGKDEARYDLYMRLLRDILMDMARLQTRGELPAQVSKGDTAVFERLSKIYTPKEWLEVWENVKTVYEETRYMHLDKAQGVLGAIWAMEKD